MDELDIIRRRQRNQRLTREALGTAPEVVAWLGAVQAQEYEEAKWSVGQRLTTGTEFQVERALTEGTILRTHILRPTWHLVSRPDIRWLLRLTSARVQAVNAHYYRRLELDAATLNQATDLLVNSLRDGQAHTRVTLVEKLLSAGIQGDGVRLALILMHAELEGVIASGPRQGRQHTYALLEAGSTSTLDADREAALAELTLRYFRSHGPAAIRDFSWWSSLTTADIRTGLALNRTTLESWTDREGRAWFGPGDRGQPGDERQAFLLPTYDESVVAYQSLRNVFDGSASGRTLLPRPLVIAGRTLGTWKRTPAKRSAVVDVSVGRPLSTEESVQLREAVERFSRFHGLPAELTDRGNLA
ncbi:MAG: winged helix DNA-binding domain-containing protein [Candidatus Dormibacteraeota bacterium]|nr:winged helix DNA-binding domain-containing protein [Candidatus Dormibacteraeota bacterium]